MTAAALDRARVALDQPPPPALTGQTTVPDGPAIGSVCTGYGGLDMAVQQVLGGHLAWVADPDPGAAAILTHHHPSVPNLGDITALDWTAVEPVDVLVGGYPCQPFSVAGLRKGTADERHIWPYIATAVRVLRPRLCLFENVAGHIRLGLADVLADLAGLGFDAEWTTLRASDVGAAHQRKRLWLAAWPADAKGPRLPGPGLRGWPAERCGRSASDAQGVGRGEGRPEPARQQRGSHALVGRGAALAVADGGRLPRVQERNGESQGAQADHHDHKRDPHGRGVADADAADHRRERGGQHGDGGLDLRTAVGSIAACPTCGCLEWVHDEGGFCAGPCGGRCAADRLPADTDRESRQQRRQSTPGEAPRGGASAVDCGCDRAPWGRYAPAVHRWERVTGSAAPAPVNERGRLAPEFVEWLMGLPAGHVTAVPGLSRTRQLKALGNGVVPAQAVAALRLLLDRAGAAR